MDFYLRKALAPCLVSTLQASQSTNVRIFVAGIFHLVSHFALDYRSRHHKFKSQLGHITHGNWSLNHFYGYSLASTFIIFLFILSLPFLSLLWFSLLFNFKNVVFIGKSMSRSTGYITKTRLFKYIENFITKNWKFSDKNSDIFHISMFLSRNKNNNVYPCEPQFYYIKMGFKGVKIIYASFHDEWLRGLRLLRQM